MPEDRYTLKAPLKVKQPNGPDKQYRAGDTVTIDDFDACQDLFYKLAREGKLMAAGPAAR